MASVIESTQYISDLAKDVDNATSCTAIQGYVDELITHVTDTIEQKADSIANIASQWAPLVDLPSDPLDILTWAAKVVGGPVAAQIELMAKQAIELAQLASALATLAGAVANAANRLERCTENAVLNALQDIENKLLEQANKALNKANELKNEILQSTGAADVSEAIQGIVDDVSEVSGTLDDVENTVDILPPV